MVAPFAACTGLMFTFEKFLCGSCAVEAVSVARSCYVSEDPLNPWDATQVPWTNLVIAVLFTLTSSLTVIFASKVRVQAATTGFCKT